MLVQIPIMPDDKQSAVAASYTANNGMDRYRPAQKAVPGTESPSHKMHLHAAGVVDARRHPRRALLGWHGQRHAMRRHGALGRQLQESVALASIQVAPGRGCGCGCGETGAAGA